VRSFWWHRAGGRVGWVGRNLGAVLVARFAMSIARALLSVVTALYLAALGFSGLELGVLFVVVTFASAVMSSGIGFLSDRAGRKPFLVVVPLVAAVSASTYAVSRSLVVLFVFAALGTFGRGAGAGGGNVGPYQPAESALVAESTPGARRTAAFGLVAFTSTLGGLAGGLLAELVHTKPGMHGAAATAAYRPAFVASASLALVAGLVALVIVEPPRDKSGGGSRQRTPIFVFPRRSWPALWRLVVTNATNGMAIGLFAPFLSYWLYRRYGAGPGRIGLLFAVVNAGSLLSTLAAASIGRRFGTVRSIATVRAISGVLLVPMVLAPSFWVAGGLYLVRMIAQRVGLPLRQSFTQQLADPAERSTVAALSNLPAQATMAGGQALAGYLFDEVSLSLPFELAAVLQCANAALYAALFAWRPPPRRDPGQTPPVRILEGDTAAGGE
jgi:MFS family permease